MTYQRRLTAAETVQRMMSVVGLTPSSSPATDVNAITQQIWTLVTTVGQELLTEFDWQFAHKDHTITTDGSLVYPLPTDFDRYAKDSHWNRTSRLPMLGSVGEQAWQELQARDLGGTTLAILFRVSGDNVELYSEPTAPQTLVLPYVSRNWCTTSAGVAKDNVDANDDIILYDPTFFQAALILEWRMTRGFDTTAAQKKYDSALASAKAKDRPAHTISLVPGGSAPLLGVVNMPETGYGA